MEINLNTDLYHALRLLVAAVETKWQIPFALEVAKEILANTEMVLDIQETLKEG